MKFTSALAATALFSASFGISSNAMANTRVVASTPAEGATVTGPRVVALTFSEALQPPTVATSIVMTAMPGVANHGDMAIRNFATVWSNKNRTMTLKLTRALRAGTYETRWQATGADGRRVRGIVSFVVK